METRDKKMLAKKVRAVAQVQDNAIMRDDFNPHKLTNLLDLRLALSAAFTELADSLEREGLDGSYTHIPDRLRHPRG